MRITYYALKDLAVGDETRHIGDLVPEAGDWPWLSGYIQNGDIAPVLVATLPEETQAMLLDWYAETHPTDEPEVGEDVEIDKTAGDDPGVPMEAPAEDAAKPKRTRRTKAQIEADNARLDEQKEAV